MKAKPKRKISVASRSVKKRTFPTKSKKPTRAESGKKIAATPSVESTPIEAVVDPALISTVPPPSLPGDQTERERAREERRRRKQEEAELREQQRIAANAGGVEVQPLQRATSGNGEIELPIPDALKYKLLYWEDRRRELGEAVKRSVLKDVQEYLQKKYSEALKLSTPYNDATRAFESAVNELLAAVQPVLPRGYAVKKVLTERGAIVAQHSPEQAGKRFRIEGL